VVGVIEKKKATIAIVTFYLGAIAEKKKVTTPIT
jgi:hypothetical protein